MAASVVHSDVFANHATTNFALARVFHLLLFFGQWRHLSKNVRLNKFARMKIINHLRVILANSLNQLTINAMIMFNALKITLLCASGKRDVPTFFKPSRLTFAQAVHNFVLLCSGHFGVEDILSAKIIRCFLDEIILHFFVRSDIHK